MTKKKKLSKRAESWCSRQHYAHLPPANNYYVDLSELLEVGEAPITARTTRLVSPITNNWGASNRRRCPYHGLALD